MSILDFYTRNQRKIDEIVDKTHFELMLSEDPLNKYFPEVSYPSTTIMLLDVLRKPTVGTLTGTADIPATKPITEITERQFRRLGIGKKYEFGSEDLEAMRQLEDYLMVQGGVGSAIVNQMNAYFFGVAADLIPALRRKHYVLMMKMMLTASIAYTDPLSKIVLNVAYPDTVPTLLPSPLAGANLWSAATTATGLFNLETHAEAYYDEFGTFSDALLMRRKDFIDLRQQDSTKAALAARVGQNLDASQISSIYIEDEALADLIKQRTKVKEVILMDAQYYEENPDDPLLPTAGYYLADGTYMFLEEGNQMMASVPSVENDWQPGVKVLAERKSEMPRMESITAWGRNVPIVKDSRKIAARKIN